MKRFTFSSCLLWLVVTIAFFIAACDGEKSEDDADDDQSPVDDDESDDDSDPFDATPPVNPFLADSPWPAAHGNPYCQDSSPLRGPEPGDDLVVSFLPGTPVSVFMLYTNPDAEGKRAVWASTAFQVYTIDANQAPLEMLSKVNKKLDIHNLMSGAYTLLDIDDTLFSPQGDAIHAYTTENPHDFRSPIVERSVFAVPDALPGEEVIGLNLTYDGRLVFATSAGRVGVITRDFNDAQMLQLGAGDEELSNSFAVDEDGGIYIVTSKTMYRVQWTGAVLTQDEARGAWSLPYEAGPQTLQPGRLSIGSGTTPTLMGFDDQDKLVVICDGQELMHLVAYWRDKIPDDWQPIAPGWDRRIAADMPVTFGDPFETNATTEQSLTVWGYDVAVVNNYFGPDALSGVFAPLLSNLPLYAPYGVEKFTWDPVRRDLVFAWANRLISCPNGVPSMSNGSGLMYCIGQRDAAWTLEAIDWETGASAFHVTLGRDIKYNSFWANTEIGPDRNIITGTFLGTLDIRPR